MAGLVVKRACTFLPVVFNCSTKRTLVRGANFESRRLLHTTRHLLAERKFTQKHEWIHVDNGVGTIGITDYAQEQLGDIVYVQLPETGDSVEENVEFGALESVKAASDVFSPATGEVSEVNDKLEDDPGLVNRSPYEDGWLIKIKLSEPGNELEALLNEEEYKQYLKDSDDH